MTLTGNLPFCSHRYAILVSYLGSRYNGSQRLVNRTDASNHDTIQEALEWSIEDIIPKKHCRTTAASRTDKGVHALYNCFTLPLQDFSIATERLKNHANYNLMRKNHDIFVKDVILVPNSFHPRRDVLDREYIYRLAVLHNYRSPSMSKKHSPLSIFHQLPIMELYRVLPLPCFNERLAREAIEMLKGKHDFASFAFKINPGEETVREMDIELEEVEPTKIDHTSTSPYSLYHLKFKSKSFLHNQVRRLVGTIVSYATYRSITLDEIQELFDKPLATTWKTNIVLAEPWGLYLSRINYNRAAFQGSIKTNLDRTEEAIRAEDIEQNWSDDEDENKEKEMCN